MYVVHAHISYLHILYIVYLWNVSHEILFLGYMYFVLICEVRNDNSNIMSNNAASEVQIQ